VTSKRLRQLFGQEGMTLIEVLIAMLVMAVAVTALVAGLGSGILALQRSAKASGAASLADQQMESLRGITYDAIATSIVTAPPADAIYRNTAWPYSSPYNATTKIELASCSQNYCLPTRTGIAAGGGTYRIDTYVNWACPTGTINTATTPPTCSAVSGITTRAVKQVTIVVRNNSDPTKSLFRETSNFDALAG